MLLKKLISKLILAIIFPFFILPSYAIDPDQGKSRPQPAASQSSELNTTQYTTWKSEDLKKLYSKACKNLKKFNDSPSLIKEDKEFGHYVGASFCTLHFFQNFVGAGKILGSAQDKPFPKIQRDQIALLLRETERNMAPLIQTGHFTIDDLWVQDMPLITCNFESGELTITHALSPLKYCTHLPSCSPNVRLLVGGERSAENPLADRYTFNIDHTKNPDMLGDAGNVLHLASLPDDKFQEIEFDFIDHHLLGDEHLLLEYKRILKENGHIHFRTEHQSPTYYQEKPEILTVYLPLLKGLFPVVEYRYFGDPDWPDPKNSDFYFFIMQNSP